MDKIKFHICLGGGGTSRDGNIASGLGDVSVMLQCLVELMFDFQQSVSVVTCYIPPSLVVVSPCFTEVIPEISQGNSSGIMG